MSDYSSASRETSLSNFYVAVIKTYGEVIARIETTDTNDILKACRTYYARGLRVRGFLLYGTKEVLFADYT